jgi:hypothetical protein
VQTVSTKDYDKASDWLQALRTYLAIVAVGSLTWEALHLPLCRLWTTGSRSEQVFAVAHCTGGDLLIALSSLMLSLLVAGDRVWPHRSFTPVAMLAVALGVAASGSISSSADHGRTPSGCLSYPLRVALGCRPFCSGSWCQL